MKRPLVLLSLFLAVLIVIGCSGSTGSPVVPDISSPGADLTAPSASRGSTSKALWGLWQVEFDRATMEFNVIPIRGAQYTVDVVTFLQPPVGNPANLSIMVTDVEEWFTQGLINVEVGLRHPFPGLDEYTGFDVFGVFMAPGTVGGQYDSDVLYTNGADEPMLLNADGYTRWMNPIEFPDTGIILDFTPGKLGTPDIGLFTSTINGYKYFADGLDVGQPVSEYFQNPINFENRGKFGPGNVNWREYQLKFPLIDDVPTLIFQYAVVASWIEPDPTLTGDPDTLEIPGDFPLSANADEAFYMEISDMSTLYYDNGDAGGNIHLALEIFDWGRLADGFDVPDEIYKIVVETSDGLIPGGYAEFDNSTSGLAFTPGLTDCSSVVEVDIPGLAPTSTDDVTALITVESFAPETFDPGTGIPMNEDRLASYFFVPIPVSGEMPEEFQITSPNGGETLWMALDHEITWNPNYPGVTDVKIEWSPDDFVSQVFTIVDSTENDGSYTWVPIPNHPTTTGLIRVSDVGGAVTDDSDDYFTIDLPVWLEYGDEVLVDTGSVAFSTVAYEQDCDEFSPALSQDFDGLAHVVWHGMRPVVTGGGTAREVVIRSFDGDNWQGNGGCFFTVGGPDIPNIRRDCLKIAPAANNTTFAMVEHWKIYFSVDVDHFINGHNDYNHPCLNVGPRIYQDGEIVCDDDYLYMIADGPMSDGPGIYCQRVTTPDSYWYAGTLKTLTGFGECSHVRSWAFQEDTLILGYWTVAEQIKLLTQTDQAADTWDDTEVVFDGNASGYSNVKDPGLAADPDGRLFMVWTAQEDATSEWHLLASMRETLSGTWTDPIIVTTSETEINDAHVTVGKNLVSLPTGADEYQVLVGYEIDGIVSSQISPKDLWAFLPEDQVSAVGDTTRDPDVMCMETPYEYDALFAWAFEVTPGDLGLGNWDVKFINGDFTTP